MLKSSNKNNKTPSREPPPPLTPPMPVANGDDVEDPEVVPPFTTTPGAQHIDSLMASAAQQNEDHEEGAPSDDQQDEPVVVQQAPVYAVMAIQENYDNDRRGPFQSLRSLQRTTSIKSNNSLFCYRGRFAALSICSTLSILYWLPSTLFLPLWVSITHFDCQCGTLIIEGSTACQVSKRVVFVAHPSAFGRFVSTEFRLPF
jgi:hypothetical protein